MIDLRRRSTAERARSWMLSLLLPGVAGTALLARPSPGVRAQAKDAPTLQASQQPLERPDAVCAKCHAAIYASYERTPMARGSGEALEGLFPGEFHDSTSGVTYRIFAREGHAWMSFAREPGSGPGALEGERELLYFVGSGTRGRTYLYQQEGEWFELPVNYYGRRDRWDMAPAYEHSPTMPPPLPVDANCLHCHASGVETPLAEARNRFPHRPFDQVGIGCSACHGDPARHLATAGHGPIVNPGKLPVAARDSGCIQCHLEGDAVVYRPGRSLAEFQPGDRLPDFAVYFVRASQAAGGQRASSQYEALLKSACKRGSGDVLTCTSCHDPHSEPAPEQRVSFFRARCLRCHTAARFVANHHPEQPDCASCHMPSRATADISHEQVTDHDIEARPESQASSSKAWMPGEQFVPVGGALAGDRELGLAYAQRAEKGDAPAGRRALDLLQRAEHAGASDEEVHEALGFLYQVAGQTKAAQQEYAQALRQNPFNATALTNLAVLYAGGGDTSESVRLLDRVVRADPSQTQAGLDLAFLECAAGQTAASSALGERLRRFNPDSADVRRFLASGVVGGQSCRAASDQSRH